MAALPKMGRAAAFKPKMMNPSITTIPAYRDNLFQQSATAAGVSLVDYNTLFNSYGY